MQSFFKFLSKLNFILLASALLYSTSFNSHQISWLGASFVSVLWRACTWVYKQANFSQIGQYHLSSCTHNRSSSPVFTSPPPAALVLASLRMSCFSWRCHSQSTKVFLVHHSHTHVISCTTHELSCTTLVYQTHTHIISCTNFMHHSRNLVHYSCAPLSCTTHVVTHSLHYSRTLVHHSRAPLSCTTHVVTHSLHYSCTLVHHSTIATVYILEILIIATVK